MQLDESATRTLGSVTQLGLGWVILLRWWWWKVRMQNIVLLLQLSGLYTTRYKYENKYKLCSFCCKSQSHDKVWHVTVMSHLLSLKMHKNRGNIMVQVPWVLGQSKLRKVQDTCPWALSSSWRSNYTKAMLCSSILDWLHESVLIGCWALSMFVPIRSLHRCRATTTRSTSIPSNATLIPQ